MARAALGAVVVVAVLASVRGIVPLQAGLVLLAVLAWFALPGLVLARRLYGAQPGSAIATVLVGPAWGYALSSLGLLALWAAGVRSAPWLLLAPVPGAIVVWPVARLAPNVVLPYLSKRDLAPIAFVLLIVPAVVGRPYSQVGRNLEEGRAYRAYFTADFVSNMAIVAEVSKGDIPPVNPYYRNDPLHYYWLMHLLPSAEYRSAGATITIEDALLVTALWTALAFAAFLYFFVRHFVDTPWTAAAAILFVLFCSSFEGAHQIKWHWDRGRTLEGLTSMNIDAITRSSYQGMPVDGLHRMFLYQPQHEVGYLLGFSSLLLLMQSRDAARAGLLFLAGSFLGLAILFSSVAAGMLTVVSASYQAWRLLLARAWRAVVPCAAAAAAPMAAAVGLSMLLRYVDRGEPVTFGVNRVATRNMWMALFLSFGPVAILAATGLIAALWRRQLHRFVPVLLTLVISLGFYFLVDIPDHLGVYVGWRAGHFLFIGMAALCAYGIQEWWKSGSTGRLAMTALLATLTVIAAPTVLFDLFNTQDVWNRNQGPGFRWTVLLSPAEVDALDWIKKFTPRQAHVQVEPTVRGRDTWAYVPAFAERRMSAGLPIGMIPLAKYEAASARIREIYASTSPEQVADLARAQCIDYLIVGGPERTAYPHFQPLLDASPHRFTPAFRNSEVAIYALPRC
jgi:hypothetical protein